MKELGYDNKDSIRLLCDNKTATNIAHKPVQRDRMKHTEIDTHFIKGKLHEDIIIAPCEKPGDQLANILTKGVATSNFHTILNKLSM